MPHVSRFLKYRSDSSGFDGMKVGMVKQGPFTVLPGEQDVPPPSKVPLGGEGDIARGEQRSNSDFADGVSTLTQPASLSNPVVYVTAAGGITPSTQPYMLVTGSNVAVTITADPQIARGREGQILTLVGVGSDLTLSHGTGLNMGNSANFTMSSGSVVCFIYTTGGTVWNETFHTIGGAI